MDYRAIGELIWFAFLGISVFTVVMGFSVRVFLAPVVRDALVRSRSKADEEQRMLGVRMERVEERLEDIETRMHRLAAAEEFHRRLGSGESDPG